MGGAADCALRLGSSSRCRHFLQLPQRQMIITFLKSFSGLRRGRPPDFRLQLSVFFSSLRFNKITRRRRAICIYLTRRYLCLKQIKLADGHRSCSLRQQPVCNNNIMRKTLQILTLLTVGALMTGIASAQSLNGNNVPDAGSTYSLLALALGGLTVLRRFFR